MSDTLTVPEASVPEAPTVAPETVAVETPAAPPRTREEARQRLRESRSVEATPVTPERSVEGTQLRDPATGRFTSPTEPEAAPAPEGEAETPAAPAGVPDGYVRIEIPEALQRNFGREQIVPKEQEEFVRWNINNSKARQELDALRAERESLRRESEEARREAEELRREKFRQEASLNVTEKWKQTPEYKAAAEKYLAIAESVGQDAADVYWQGEQAKLRSLVDSEYETRVSEIERQAVQRQAARFVESVRANAARDLPAEISSHPRFQAVFQNARVVYGTMISQQEQSGVAVTPDPAEFARVLRAQIMADPEIVQSVKRNMAAQQAAKSKADTERAARDAEIRAASERAAIEAVERFKRESAERRNAAPPNPLGRLESVNARASTAEPETVDPRTLVGPQLREHYRERLRSR